MALQHSRANANAQPALAVEATGLTKRYEDVVAVRDLDLSIRAHSIYALLGPNGAGKTTTVSLLTTLIRPTSGTARVAGYDVVREARQVRRRIGVTFQEMVLDEDLTGRMVLDIHGRLYGLGRTARLARLRAVIELVGLEDALDRLVGTYSGGMKRRLELARGLMTDPEVLFLDEPTLGLDVQNRVVIWEHVRRLQAERGLTVVLTTNYMEEAEALADVVGIIDQVCLVVEGAPKNLVGTLGADVIRLQIDGSPQAAASALEGQPLVQTVSTGGDHVVVGVSSSSQALAPIIERLVANGVNIGEVSIARPTLSDVFLKYTGRRLRDQ